FFSLPQGSSIVDPWHLHAKELKGFDRVLLIPSLRNLPNALCDADINAPKLVVPFEVASYSTQDDRAWFRWVLGRWQDDAFGAATHLRARGSRLLIKEETLREYRRPGLIAKYYWDAIREEFHIGGWVLLQSGDCTGPGLDFRR